MRVILISMCIAGGIMTCNAQNSKRNQQDFDDFRNEINKDFDNFRSEITQDFIDFLRNPWKDFEMTAPVPKPQIEPIPPIDFPIDDKHKNLPLVDKPIVIDNVIKPLPIIPQPEPIEPIDEIPVVTEEESLSFEFFGTACKVRYVSETNYRINSITENSIADAFTLLATDKYDNLIYDCLKIRSDLQLCDWAYLLFLKSMAETACGKNTNEATLLMAYVYLQSGYKMRLAHDGTKLYMLYSSRHAIFGKPSYYLDGISFYGLEDLPSNLRISNASFPEEQSLSLIINQQPLLTVDVSDKRSIASTRYSSFTFSSEINKNLLAFYSTYPSSYYNEDFMTQWAQYANTPIAPNVAESLYPSIRKAVAGLSELEAVNRLLNWVQTGFKYEYDDKVWGHDRSFFAEESLYYPYCDCEDRSILLSRIVRDVLKLKCILIYYPGHLAIAVRFNEDVKGDYISVNGNRFLVCDPTYIGASVGMTMPDMDNASASIIILE
ncbi:MAG: hypothetical protein MJY81_04845 [Bacteroidaceae bacterium]|nr:hypothetical protein [Bacteroidaceae bacterium]